MNYLNDITIIIFSYFLGSIPFGLLIAIMYGKGDIRKKGSGNIGATNVLRTSGKKLGAFTLLLDSIKGVIAVLLAKKVGTSDTIVAVSGFFAVMGHIFPVWLKFRGGKGVATTIAVYLAISFKLGIFACVIWIATFHLTRISSISSIVTVLFSIVAAFFFVGLKFFILCFFLAIIIIAKHKDNVLRLFDGEEKQL